MKQRIWVDADSDLRVESRRQKTGERKKERKKRK